MNTTTAPPLYMPPKPRPTPHQLYELLDANGIDSVRIGRSRKFPPSAAPTSADFDRTNKKSEPIARRRAGSRTAGRRSTSAEKDGKWHGWVVVGVKEDGSLDRRHRMAKTEPEVTEKVRKLESERNAGELR